MSAKGSSKGSMKTVNNNSNPYTNMPDLVYSEDSSDEEMDEHQKELQRIAGAWLKRIKTPEDRKKQGQVIKIYVLAPFLFGQVHQPEKWFKFAGNAGLLPTDEKFLYENLNVLDMATFQRMEVVEAACGIILDNLWDLKKLRAFLNLIKKLEGAKITSVPQLVKEAKSEPLVVKWSKLISDEESRSIVAVLFAAQQYCKHVIAFVEKGHDFLKDYDEMYKFDEKKDFIQYKENGNRAYSEDNYRQAASEYTQGLYQSRFNHLLYSNRAQAYLKMDKYDAALCDSKRCILLQPDWLKGRYRFAEAWFGLRQWKRAVTENTKAINIRHSLGDKEVRGDLETQRKRFLQKEKDMHAGLISDTDDSDVPDLVDSSCTESSDDGDEADNEVEEKEAKVPAASTTAKGLSQNKKVAPPAKSSAPQSPATGPEDKRRPYEELSKIHNAVISNAEKRKEDFQRHLREGSKHLIEHRCRQAVLSFSHSMDMLGSSENPVTEWTTLGMDEKAVLLIKYALGTACVEFGKLQEIEKAIILFEAIARKGLEFFFPLAHLGIGRAFHKQNRFKDALRPLREALSKVAPDSAYPEYCWPGTKNPLPETKPGQLLIALKSLLELCMHPPPPDAICRSKDCRGHHKIQIYHSDPDFQGLVRTECFLHCIITFHIECWKRLKSSGKERRSDKEILNGPCFTPDCPACIFTITIYDKDATIIKQLENTEKSDAMIKKEKPKKVAKMKASSQSKIERREERKRARKQYKQKVETETEDDNNAIVDTIEEIEKATATDRTRAMDSQNGNDEDNANDEADEGDSMPVRSDCMTVLKREEEERQDELYKGAKTNQKAKSKRKKEKYKQTLSLTEFVGTGNSDAGHTPEFESPDAAGDSGTMGIDDFDEGFHNKYPSLDSKNPFSIPDHLRAEVASHEKLYCGSSSSSSVSVPHMQQQQQQQQQHQDPTTEVDVKTQDIKETIFSLFIGILEEHGPLQVDDMIINRELEEFPPEARTVISQAGGIGKFLIASLQFAMVDDFVCVMKDAAKARQRADEHKQLMATSAPSFSANSFPSVAETLSGRQSAVSETSLPRSQTSNGPEAASCHLTTPIPGEFGTPTTTIRETFRRQIHGGSSQTETEKWDSASGTAVHNVHRVNPIRKPSPPVVREAGLSNNSGLEPIESPKQNVVSPAITESLSYSWNPSSEGLDSKMADIWNRPMDGSNQNGKERLHSQTPPGFGTETLSVPGARSEADDRKKLENSQAETFIATENPSDANNGDRFLPGMNIAGDDQLQNSPSPETAHFPSAPSSDKNNTMLSFPGLRHNNSKLSLAGKSTASNDDVSSQGSGAHPSALSSKSSDSNAIDALVFKHLQERVSHNGNDKGSSDNFSNTLDGLVLKHLQDQDNQSVDSVDSFGSLGRASMAKEKEEPNSVDALVLKHLQEMDASTGSSKSLPSAGSEDSAAESVDDLVKKHLEDLDNKWMRDMAASVMRNLKQHEAFQEDPDLLDNIMGDIQKDLKASENTADSVSQSGPQKPAKPTTEYRSIGLQSVLQPSSCDVGTNTLIDNLEWQLKDAEKMNQQLLSQMVELTRIYTAAKDELEDDVKTLTKSNGILLEERKGLKQKLAKAEKEAETAVTKLERAEYDRKVLQEEMKLLKKQIKDLEKESKSMKTKHSDKERQISEMKTALSTEREHRNVERTQMSSMLKTVQDRFKEEDQKRNQICQAEATRAQTAEVELLQLKMNVGKQVLEKSLKDAQMYVAQFSHHCARFKTNGQDPPPPLVSARHEWQATVDEIKKMGTQSIMDFELQIKQVQAGEKVSELPPLQIPQPPAAPDVSFMLQQGKSSPGRQTDSATSSGPPPSSNFESVIGNGPPQQPLPQSQPPPPPPQDSLVAGLRQTAMAAAANTWPLPDDRPLQQPSPAESMAAASFQPQRYNAPPGLSNLNNPLSFPKVTRPGNVGPRLQPCRAKNSYNKIMDSLRSMFPNYKETEIAKFIQDFRASRQGSLSGMSLPDIIQQVSERIIRYQNVPMYQAGVPPPTAAGITPIGSVAPQMPMGLVVSRTGQSTPSSSGSGTPLSRAATPVNSEIFEEEEDPCIICHDDLQPHSTTVLQCAHRYHTECIRRWFQQQSTCPTCRVHSLLPDEFPALS